ncbi:beta-glucosidase F like protein [Verticillium longisporum]|uniref:beta-glucosidase n=2 Tax=Verticillium TaxID=1036719 RepID=A0A8I3AMK3_VERLO|nr:beta-glucosidase F like protein [Verticillium longisporum]KAH6705753.1 glycosyl hydrolase family 3 C-terminal domain-containing protein [Verticillium dahliae]PNH26941.1 hypothetical protein BJF96_g9770 [Verticillium dahliae]
MAMPGDTQVPLLGYSYWMYDLAHSVLNGSVPMDRLNDMTTSIFATWLKFGQDKGFPKVNFHLLSNDASKRTTTWSQEKLLKDAITLLKNNDSLLPIATSRSIKVFGTAAQTNPDGPNACDFRSCNKGVLGMGWGSGVVDYMYIDDPIGALRKRAGNVEYFATDNFPRVPTPNANDVAIVFITSGSGENSFTVEGNKGDRNSDGLRAWHNGDRLVKDVAAAYSNAIVVV